MAITATTLTIGVANPPGKTLFAINFYTADAQGAEVIKAAPSVGAIFLTKLTLNVDGDITVDVGSGENSSAVEIAAFKFVATATGLRFSEAFEYPIKLVDLKALVIDSSGVGAISGFVEGFVTR